MKTLLCTTAVALLATIGTANATVFGDTTNNNSSASASAKQSQTSILNQQQLSLLKSQNTATGGGGGSTGSVSVSQDGDDMFSSIAFSVGLSSSAVPSDGFKGVKNYGVHSIFGGFQIPAEIDDTTKAYQALGAGIVKVWFDPNPAIDPRQRIFEKALICNMVAGVKDAVEDAGQKCPSN